MSLDCSCATLNDHACRYPVITQPVPGLMHHSMKHNHNTYIWSSSGAPPGVKLIQELLTDCQADTYSVSQCILSPPILAVWSLSVDPAPRQSTAATPLPGGQSAAQCEEHSRHTKNSTRNSFMENPFNSTYCEAD